MMLSKTLLLTVLAGLAAPLVSMAADEVVDADITDVTVFTDRAEVTRTATLKLAAGEHTLIFEDLPRAVQRNSLQVDGTGAFTLQDVRFLTEQVTGVDGKLQELLDDQQQLRDEGQALELAAERITAMRKAVDDVLARITSTPKETNAETPMDAVKWTEMLTFYNVQNEKLDQSVLENARAKRENLEVLNRVQREINQLNASSRPVRNSAHVLVSLDNEAEIAVQLSYLVTGPRWYPSYDIRADSSSGQVGITYYGNVTQSTGEDWTAAKLSLSTAQPQTGGREPQLTPWFISEFVVPLGRTAPVARDASEPMVQMFQENMMALSEDFNQAPFSPSDEPMRINTATVQSGATAVVYQIPGTTEIVSNNQPVRLTVARETFTGSYRHSAVPSLSPYVYLKTKVTNSSDHVFLPGQTQIYLDGSFISKASMDLVSPGQSFWTWLGIDQGVSVERKLITEEDGTSGFFGSSKNRTYRYEFEIENNKRKAVELVLWDQLPISQNEKIKVELIEPEGVSDTFKMNTEKFVEWIFTLQAGEERDVPFAFEVSWPEDMQISGL